MVIEISIGNTKTISIYSTFGNNIDHYRISPSAYIDSIKILQDTVYGLNNYKNDDLWNYFKRSKTQAEYLLVLTQEDFKIKK